MKTLATLHMTQRTALGADQSARTRLYLLQGVESKESVNIYTAQDRKDLKGLEGVRALGKVTIVHPWVMAGSWEEILGYMMRKALDRLEDLGIIEYNDYGVPFLRAGAPAQ